MCSHVPCLLIDDGDNSNNDTELPSYYESVTDEESPPPSYSECVPLPIPIPKPTTLPVMVEIDNILIIKSRTTSQPLHPSLTKSAPVITHTISCPSIATN